MSDERKYLRFYYNQFTREFPAAFADPATLGAWLKLLTLSEQVWPGSPELPSWARGRLLRALIDLGLVELVPPHSFRVRGHAAERLRRHDAAKDAAKKRWQNGRNADA